MNTILGISAFYHDSAAALVSEKGIIAAAQEERFTRIKHDPSFPRNAIQYCLDEAGLSLSDVDQIVFYDKPFLKFERLLETYSSYAPRGFRSFLAAMPVWLKDKLYLKQTLRKELTSLSGLKRQDLPPLLFTEHHQSHAASAFYPSPFDSAAVMCIDGVGEWATTSIWQGNQDGLKPLWQIDFPHSLGLLYSAFTYFTGFKVNSGEYKLMGLAPYGEPKYVQQILDNLIDVRDDGTFRLNMKYFAYATVLTMTNDAFAKLFDGPRRDPESEITQREMDLAASIQVVTEEIVLRLARTVQKETGEKHLCLAGGVALNCVANGRLLREGPFEDIWIQPAAGDAGGALGAALCGLHEYQSVPRKVDASDSMKGSYLGPQFTEEQIQSELDSYNAVYEILPDNQLMPKVAELLATDKVIGWFQGRMEFGPRALGGRSIIGDPRSEKMQSVMNLKIKYRESFRPFAPSVLNDRVGDYFRLNDISPYMLVVDNVKDELIIELTEDQQKLTGIDKLNLKRSELPAITHVDGSARIQTVHEDTNPRYHALLKAFEAQTDCGVVVNTSFNVRGEPIVCTPSDAFRCFMRTEMDALVVGDFLLTKKDQTPWEGDDKWQEEFALD